MFLNSFIPMILVLFIHNGPSSPQPLLSQWPRDTVPPQQKTFSFKEKKSVEKYGLDPFPTPTSAVV